MLNLLRFLEAQPKLDDEFFESVLPKAAARLYFTNEFLYFLAKYTIEFK